MFNVNPSSQREKVISFQSRHRLRMVTLLFTDTVGSTRLKSELGDSRAVELIHEHHRVLRQVLARYSEGEEIGTAGDSFFLVFSRPSDAVEFSLEAQRELRRLAERTGVVSRDRIGIHVGEVFIAETEGEGREAKDLYGLQVDTCARIMSLADGDQILMSRFVFDNARQVFKGQDTPGLEPLSWLNHGAYRFKGLEEPLVVCEVGETGRAVLRAPADSEKAARRVAAGEELVLGWRPAVGQTVPRTQWQLEAKLGEGGFGEVWLGRHERLKQERVFKFCFRADRVRYLKRELTLFKLLQDKCGQHPRIVGIQEVNFEEAPYYLMMEYAAGKSLGEWVEAQGGWEGVSGEVKLEIAAQVAEALAAAHGAGVVHRDVKPGNILVEGNGKEAATIRVKLTDFGVGKVIEQEYLDGRTQGGFTQTLMGREGVGTPLYMAPEVLEGKGAGPAADVYALGVVLYQMWVRDFRKAMSGEWYVDIVDRRMQELLSSCLAEDPDRRVSNAADLATRLRKQARKERRAAVWAAVFSPFLVNFLCGIIFIGIGLWFGVRSFRSSAVGDLAARTAGACGLLCVGIVLIIASARKYRAFVFLWAGFVYLAIDIVSFIASYSSDVIGIFIVSLGPAATLFLVSYRLHRKRLLHALKGSKNRSVRYGRKKSKLTLLWPAARKVIWGSVALLLLTSAFYLVENWRGKRVWEAYVKELEAKGHKVYWSMPQPPNIPPEQNFTKTPLLIAIGERNNGVIRDQFRYDRIRSSLYDKLFYFLGDCGHGQSYDARGLFNDFMMKGSHAAEYSNATPDTIGLALLRPIEAEMNELRQASQRAYARFIPVWPNDPMQMELPHLAAYRLFARAFSLSASAKLRTGDVAGAFQDLKVIHKLAESMSDPKTLVEGMMGAAFYGLSLQAFGEGWVSHQWSPAQLEYFKNYLGSVKLVSSVQRVFGNEETESFATCLLVLKIPIMSFIKARETETPSLRVSDRLLQILIPRGWIYQSVYYASKINRDYNQTGYNHQNDYYDPGSVVRAEDIEQKLKSIPRPCRMLVSATFIPNYGKAKEFAAYTQTQINEAAIVCALELYRRAEGRYPETLDALAPRYMPRIPQDVIKGQPLHYRPTPDGRFVLYSVGWNEKDEGGVNDPGGDLTKGDWAWPWPAESAPRP